MPEPGVVKKSAFAALRGVSPARVTQWIAAGKISGAAIVGDGRSAMIDVDLATAQLRERLDVGGRFGLKGLSTRLDGAPPVAPAAQLSLPLGDSVEAQIKAEKLRQAQLMTSRLEEEDRQRRGLYVEAQAARNEMVRLAADLLGSFEGSLTDLSAALAAQFHLPGRDVLHVLRREFRRVRERLAGAHAAAAAAEPRTIHAVEDEAGSIQ